MKKLVLTMAWIVMAATVTFAQRFAYVDTDLILENVPEYAEAQKELDELSIQWQNEIEQKYAEIDRLYKDYQAEQILLSEDMKRKREDEIIRKEKEAKEMQRQRFGVEGDLFKKRQELVSPLQDKVFNAVKDIAESGNYAMIFDKASQSNILYSDKKYDKSEDVLKKLGYKLGSK